MSDQRFYVGSERRGEFTGYVPAKFLMVNGQFVVDPAPGGSQHAYIYSDGSGRAKTHGAYANPNNYLIVPANFSEQRARSYANRIVEVRKIPIIGEALARAKMGLEFKPGGAQDLQRDPQWGIPEGSIAPAFVSSASHYLGFVGGLTDTPLQNIEKAGGFTNGGPKTGGPYGVSLQNHVNLVKGYADAGATSKPAWLMNGFGYGSQGKAADGQMGDGRGIAGWVSSLYGIDAENPTRPVPHQPTSEPLELLNEPMPQWTVPPPIFDTR